MKYSIALILVIAATALLSMSCQVALPPIPLVPDEPETGGDSAALPPDIVNDVRRPTAGTFAYETLLPVELSLDVGLYEPMGSPALADGSIIIATLEDPSGNLVYAARVPDGHLQTVVMLPSAPLGMTLTLHTDGFEDRSVSIPDMALYSEVGRTMGMLAVGDRPRSIDPLDDDRDGDLIPDVYDAFPDDPESAFAFKIPADGSLTVAWEDLYGQAQAGDADYNDFIAQYSITEVRNGGNELHRIELGAEATEKLAGYNHRFGIRVDSFEGSAHLTGVAIDENGNAVAIDRTEASSANVELFADSSVALNKPAAFILEFDTPQPLDAAVDRPPYNPYLVVLDTSQEIHLMGEQDLAGVAQSYQDDEGFPWGLLIPADWVNPDETQRIEVHYPRFTNWRMSLGAQFTDWYLHYDDPYTPPEDAICLESPVTATVDEESNPRLGRDAVGDIVVSTSQTLLGSGSYDGDILYQRLAPDGSPDGTPVMVSADDATDDKFNDISGSRIVYTAFDTSTTPIGRLKVYQIDTGVTTDVMPDADTYREVRIDGSVVVWTQGQNGATKIVYRDLSWAPGTTFVLCGPTPASSNVEIGSRYVVWEKVINGQKDIAAYDRLTGAFIAVSPDASLDERLPTTFGNWVAWQAESATGMTIRLANLAVKPVTSFAAVDDGSSVARPSIDEGLVAFESDLTGNLDVWLYRISDARIFQVTHDAAHQFLNNLSGDHVVYVDLRGASLDVYVSTFWLPPAE